MNDGSEESLARGLAQAARGEAVPRDDLLTDTGPSLTEFLLARIAEDEAGAGDTYEIRNGYGVQRVLRTSDDPSPRVLAECEAKRRIVEAHPLVAGVDVGVTGGLTGCQTCHALDRVHEDAIVEALGPCDTLLALALPYADHPDYRDEWRP